MAVVFVNRTSAEDDASSTTLSLPALNFVTGNAAVAIFSWMTTDRSPTVTDTANNTYTPGTKVKHSVTGFWIQPFVAVNVTGHATNVVQANPGGTCEYRALSVRQFSGVATATPVDDEDTAQGDPVSTLTTPTMTASGAGVIVVGAVTFSEGNTFSSATGQNIVEIETQSTHGSGHRILTGGGSVTGGLAWTNAGGAVLVGIILKAAAVVTNVVNPLSGRGGGKARPLI